MAYTIVKGENTSPSALAKKLGMSEAQLRALNPEAFKSGAFNYAGTVLRTKSGEPLGKQVTPQSKDSITGLAESITKNVKKVTPFDQVYGGLDDYLKAQSPLAQQGVAQQTNRFFLPQIDEGIANVRTELANRGLFRSGIRGKQEGAFLTDIADQEGQQREALFAQREKELRDRYAREQSLYEKATSTGAKYKPTEANWNKPVVVNPSFNPAGQLSGDRYSPVSAYQGQDSTSKYGEAYRRWFEDKFKKTRPDVNYNI
jgi:hypothetical protein